MLPFASTGTQTADALVFLGKVAEWVKTAPEQDHVPGSQFHVAYVELGYDGQNDGLGRFYNEDPDWMWEQQNDLTGTCGKAAPEYLAKANDGMVCNRPRSHRGPHALIAQSWT